MMDMTLHFNDNFSVSKELKWKKGDKKICEAFLVHFCCQKSQSGNFDSERSRQTLTRTQHVYNELS